MHKLKGVALFEMILSLLLFSILAGAVIELFAHPIQDYLWQMRTLNKLDDMKACLNILARDLARADEVHVEKNPHTEKLILQTTNAERIEYFFSNQDHHVERKNAVAVQTLLLNTDATLMPFSNKKSKGLVITFQTTEKGKVKLAIPVLIPGA